MHKLANCHLKGKNLFDKLLIVHENLFENPLACKNVRDDF